MQEEKSAVYTVILGVCLLLCLLMLGNMLMGRADTGTAPAAPEEGDAMEFHITEDDIASVMTEALPFPVEDTAVKISRDGTIAVTAAVTRQALTESNLVPGKLRTALLFLPERCKLYGAWSAAVSNGKLSLACRTIKLEGFTLPEQTAQALSDAFAAQWNTRMEQRDFTPQTIQWQDGERRAVRRGLQLRGKEITCSAHRPERRAGPRWRHSARRGP